MADTIAQMSKAELSALIETVVEQRLLDIFGDPDEGLQLEEGVRRRLLRQMQQVAAGERGRPLKDVLPEMPSG